jgi:biotin operon repressor
MSEQNYFYIIPAKLAEEGNMTKAMLYGLISSLANKQGYCWASNEYLAKKLKRKDPTKISKYITQLKKDNWIDIEVNKEKGNIRKIWISMGGIGKKAKTSWQKSQDPYWQKSQESNISNSNIKEYPLETSSRGRDELKFPKEAYNEIIKEYESLTGIKHSGDEYKPLLQTIKTMFKSGRTKEQIIKCMHFINNRPEECWANWNLNTIKNQLPRFLSGKF